MNKKDIIQIIKYGICGGITTGINLVIFYVLNEMKVYYLLANMVGYYIAVVINFFMNDKLVFDSQDSGRTGIRLLKFIYLRTGSLLADSAIFYVLVSIMGFPVYITRVCLSAVIILFNYFWSKKKIF